MTTTTRKDQTMTTTTTTTLWAAGHNLAGYLPDNEPDLCATADGARDALEWHLDSLADNLAMGDEPEDETDDEMSELAQCEEALNELAGADLPADDGFLAYVGHSAYWISSVPREDWPDELAELVDNGASLSDALDAYHDLIG